MKLFTKLLDVKEAEDVASKFFFLAYEMLLGLANKKLEHVTNSRVLITPMKSRKTRLQSSTPGRATGFKAKLIELV